MSRNALRFWASALLLPLVFAVATAFWFPYGALRLRTDAEQWRAWLLTLWTGGILAVLFGISGLFAFLTPLGFREVTEAGSLTAALEARRRAKTTRDEFHTNFAWWLVCTGALQITLYFVIWTLRIGA